MPSGDQDSQNEMQKADEIQQRALSFNPDDYVTEDVQRNLWDILTWHDTIMRRISTIMEKVPGLEQTKSQLADALNVCESHPKEGWHEV